MVTPAELAGNRRSKDLEKQTRATALTGRKGLFRALANREYPPPEMKRRPLRKAAVGAMDFRRAADEDSYPICELLATAISVLLRKEAAPIAR
jgi:hypothetical protein